MIITEQVFLCDPMETIHSSHERDNICMNLFIASFEMNVDYDESSGNRGIWQAVFSLKDLKTLKNDEVAITLACVAKSLFNLLFHSAECVGNKTISCRVSFEDPDTNGIELSQLFSLLITDDKEACSSSLEPDKRAISHCFATFSKDKLEGTLTFIFNDPQAEQIHKIMTVLSSIYPPPALPEEVEDSYIMAPIRKVLGYFGY